jgi:hypothetical protein
VSIKLSFYAKVAVDIDVEVGKSESRLIPKNVWAAAYAMRLALKD